MTTADTSYRLPTNVRPETYHLTLAPDLERFTFQGEETVDIEVIEPTARIVVNTIELEIDAAEVTLGDGTTLAAGEVSLHESSETATFTFDRELPRGRATLHLRFRGTLNDQLRGFYRSRYLTPTGDERYLATTQFEATDARRAFPCWDEPSIKAAYDVTLVVPEQLTAISNMPAESETPRGDGTRAIRFAESPRMSTYLVAFIVGDLASVEERHPSGTLVRVWTTRGNEHQGLFALENAVSLLTYFNGYFGIPYPLPKLDHIAIPDFAAGAMENWGAITYRETALLFDPQNSAAATRQRILEVVAHEMAHMWFGDLVTMTWWDDLWLNESFASWMGDKAVDHLYPEWQMWTQFVSHDTNVGLGLDGLRNSHPIEVEVRDPAEIREIFDAISYSKGGSILRMLEEYLAPEVFRRGLGDYLGRNQYANARTEDLWSALETASGKPVTAVMDSWTKQTGYPVVQVEAERSSDELTLHLTQRRFLYEHLLDGGADDGTLWKAPVGAVRAGGLERRSALMEEREASLPMGRGIVPLPQDWVKVNHGQTGFYRVSYPEAEWDRLQGAVQQQFLSPTDRLGLQNDAWALARAGYGQAARFLSLVEAYQSESDPTVWGDVAANLASLETMLYDEPFLDRFYAFGRNLLQGIVQRVGWEPGPGEGHLDSLLRSTVLGRAGAYGDRAVIAEAKRRFDAYLRDPASLRPDLRGVVYGIVGQEGDRAAYEQLWDLERKAQLHEEKMRFLGALARSGQPDLLRETLERSLDPQEVRSQDTVLVIVAVAGTRYGRDLAWQFVKDNWSEFDRRYGRGGFAITRLVAIAGNFTTMERHREVDEFFKEHPAPSAARTIQQALERIRVNATWLERNRRELADWFAMRG